MSIDIEDVINKTIAMIYADEGIQRAIRRDRLAKRDRFHFPKIRPDKEPISVKKKSRAVKQKWDRNKPWPTPLCDAVIAKHRDEMRKIAEAIAESKKCRCKNLVDHWLRCARHFFPLFPDPNKN